MVLKDNTCTDHKQKKKKSFFAIPYQITDQNYLDLHILWFSNVGSKLKNESGKWGYTDEKSSILIFLIGVLSLCKKVRLFKPFPLYDSNDSMGYQILRRLSL